MAHTCPNCGKKQTVVINHRRYCVHCGEAVKSHTKRQPITQTASAVKSAPKAAVPHRLDLSRTRPAQKVHGRRTAAVPKPTPVRPPITNTASLHKQKASRRHAAKAAKHPQIHRFQSNPASQTTSRPKTMTPHHSYRLSAATAAKATPTLTTPRSRHRKRLVDSFKFKLKHQRLAPAAAAIAVVLILSGYITYLNVPSLAVRVAASKAGIDPQLPNYRPPSYSLSGLISYDRGHLTIRYQAGDERGYIDLTQRQTQWDPPTLLENYVAPKSANYIPYNQNGLTIYVYRGNHAAWINNGMFFTLEGENQLSQEEVLRMAASL